MKRIFTNPSVFQGIWLSSVNESIRIFLKRLREYKERMRKAGIKPRLILHATSTGNYLLPDSLSLKTN